MREIPNEQPNQPEQGRNLFGSMSSGEFFDNDLGNKKRQREKPKELLEASQMILMSAVARYNEHKEEGIPIFDNTQFALNIYGENDLLQVKITHEDGSCFVKVGHYDPGMRKFLFYPEVLPSDETAVIEQIAMQQRIEAICVRSDYDVDSDIIRDLHVKHREVLLADDLIYKLAERSSTLSLRNTPWIDEHWVDNYTSFFVGLSPQLGGINKKDPMSSQIGDYFTIEDAFISIVFKGDLYRQGAKTIRKTGSFLHLGYRDFNAPNEQYVPERELITDSEFGTVVDLITEMRSLQATTYPKLNIQNLALKR